MVSSIKCDCC